MCIPGTGHRRTIGTGDGIMTKAHYNMMYEYDDITFGIAVVVGIGDEVG
jgi:hypothetical protein